MQPAASTPTRHARAPLPFAAIALLALVLLTVQDRSPADITATDSYGNEYTETFTFTVSGEGEGE